ncbi:MAG: hypothetical protein EKK64_00980 [Neisseriaceae bacterium]|nr:MAG: hypothetical protein EKK64_00980 [Neisseriaceae bacterium]
MQMRYKNQGMALAMVLMCLSIMSVMVYGVSQMISSQQRSASNYVDMKIAENYARAAIFDAESRVYFFDLENQMESPPISCIDAVKALGGDSSKYAGSNCLSLRRGWRLQHLQNGTNIIPNGVRCNQGDAKNKGFCFNNRLSTGNLFNTTFDSDIAWQPWKISGSTSTELKKPCSNTYTRTEIPWIDDGDSRYSIEYPINDPRNCANPRYIIEPINLDFRGHYGQLTDTIGGTENTYENDKLIQKNDAAITLYKMNESSSLVYQENTEPSSPLIPSARLYRITAVAFGHNGNTRVTLQEVIAVSNFVPNAFEYRDTDKRDTADNFAFRIQRISTRWIN